MLVKSSACLSFGNGGQSLGQDRIGVAVLTKMAFDGADFGPLWNALIEAIANNPSNAAAAMDMSAIAQLLGDQASGLALQSAALKKERLYRSCFGTEEPRLRLLALAAPTDIGGNTPIEFLLEYSAIELHTLYAVPELPLPNRLPEHDLAIVVAPASQSTCVSLDSIGSLAKKLRRPLLNAPDRIWDLDRDRLHVLLKSAPGLVIPATAKISRRRLMAICDDPQALDRILDGCEFPLIVRPIDSHAGRGLAKIDHPLAIPDYLMDRSEDQFFLSPFVDYRSPDGLFRKYRIVFVDGSPYACHMAISDRWNLWYLNAEMAANPAKRVEEQHFMAAFDEEFAQRHRKALAAIAERIGLEYFAVDCAETNAGELLLFEADNAMIVHNMDPAGIYPYKPPQMRKIFDAFVAMLFKYAGAPPM